MGTIRYVPAAFLLLLLIACGKDEVGDGDLATPWDQWTVTGVVGDSFPDPNDFIGSVSYTLVLSDTSVAVLDRTNIKVWVLGMDGRILAQGGRRGQGPGEYVDPVSIAALSPDSLIVVDRTLRRLDIVAVERGTLSHVRTQSLDFHLNASCAMGDALFTLGASDHAIIHSARLAASLDEQFRIRHPAYGSSASGDSAQTLMLRSLSLRGGPFVCVPDENVIVHATENTGEVFGIDSDGALTWSTNLPDFVPPVQAMSPAGGVRTDLNPEFGYSDYVISASDIGNGLVQIVSRRSFPRGSGLTAESAGYVIRASDGAVVGQASSPPHFGASSGSIVVEHLEEPTPHVRIWKRR